MKNIFLLLAAISSGLAALLHLGCIIFGASWYRFLGAGEQMAQMAEAGHIYPTIVTLVIVLVLTIWSLYALSGAGLILRLPLLRFGLCVITTIYLLRGTTFVLLFPMFPDHSMTFWVTSSAISFMIGLIYLIGIKQSWLYLNPKNT